MASLSQPVNLGVREQLVHESLAMVQYALASGMYVPPPVASAVEKARVEPADPLADVGALSKVHDQLAKLVAPATPRALLLLGPDYPGNGLAAMLGSVGLVRRMIVAAVASMVVYITVGLSDQVNGSIQTIQNSSGVTLLLNELAWLSAAAMGASFAILMQVSGYVVKRNYDARYEPSYWIKFFLGIMAGFILVQIIPFAEATGSDPNLSQLMVALVGGFSASAVFRILTRVVDAVESLFRADTKSEINRRETDARNRAAEETSLVRMGLAARVVNLQQQVSAGTDPAALTAQLREMLAALVPGSMPESGEPAVPAPSPAPEGTIALPGVSVVSAPETPETADAPDASAEAPEPTPASSDAG